MPLRVRGRGRGVRGVSEAQREGENWTEGRERMSGMVFKGGWPSGGGGGGG